MDKLLKSENLVCSLDSQCTKVTLYRRENLPEMKDNELRIESPKFSVIIVESPKLCSAIVEPSKLCSILVCRSIGDKVRNLEVSGRDMRLDLAIGVENCGNLIESWVLRVLFDLSKFVSESSRIFFSCDEIFGSLKLVEFWPTFCFSVKIKGATLKFSPSALSVKTFLVKVWLRELSIILTESPWLWILVGSGLQISFSVKFLSVKFCLEELSSKTSWPWVLKSSGLKIPAPAFVSGLLTTLGEFWTRPTG